jgi:murein DD-endopeptidase MepM/ murein hydrolase activator NlpD
MMIAETPVALADCSEPPLGNPFTGTLVPVNQIITNFMQATLPARCNLPNFNGFHEGLDLEKPVNTPILSSTSGRVVIGSTDEHSSESGLPSMPI